jgi:hypothetical protein
MMMVTMMTMIDGETTCGLQENWPQPDEKHTVKRKETKMVYKFAYLPAGLFNRAQVSRLYFQLSGWRTLRKFSDFRDFCFHFRENYADFSSKCLCFQRIFNLPIEFSENFS